MIAQTISVRSLLLTVAIAIGFTSPSVALDEFDEGAKAYTEGRHVDAFQAWTKAAMTGNPSAQYNLGLMYLKGIGTQQNFVQAFQWFAKASKNGVPGASIQTAKMFKQGIGVPKDNQTALVFLDAGISSLPPGSCRALAEEERQQLVRLLGTAQIEQSIREAEHVSKVEKVGRPDLWKSPSCLQDVILPASAAASMADTADGKQPGTPASNRSVSRKADSVSPANTPAATKEDRRAPAVPVIYFVQVASYQKRMDANRAQLKFEQQHGDILGGAGIIVTQGTVPRLGEVYRIRIGPFEQQDAAASACEAIQRRQEDCFVVASEKEESARWLAPPSLDRR